MQQRIYLPSASPSAHLSMALKPLALEDWIEIDEQLEHYLTLKKYLLDHHYLAVFDSLAGTQAAQQEVLDVLLDHLLTHFPDTYQQQGDRILNSVTQDVWHLQAFTENPLDLAGRLVQEDLCLMELRDGNYILSAASLCFPAHWRLQDKLGRAIAQIHNPVPGYPETLEHPVDQFFERLKSDRPVYRMNWSITTTPDLSLDYVRSSQQNQEITIATIGKTLWLRMERQTLRRLDNSRSVLFAIRTYVYPLSILEAHPRAAQNLANRIQKASSDLLSYKSILPFQEILLKYLAQIAQK